MHRPYSNRQNNNNEYHYNRANSHRSYSYGFFIVVAITIIATRVYGVRCYIILYNKIIDVCPCVYYCTLTVYIHAFSGVILRGAYKQYYNESTHRGLQAYIKKPP